MLTPHRQTPNRKRELREQVNALVREWIGAGLICRRCGATLGNFADKCEADLDEACPGQNAIELQRQRAEEQVGLL